MLKIVAALFVLLIIAIGLRLIFMLRDVAGFRQFWSSKAQQQPADNALVYIALGNSAAQGIGATEPMKGYVGLVAKELEAQTGRPVHIINLSVSGATVEATREEQVPKLMDIKELDKAVITIDIGANDVNRNFIDKVEFEKQFDLLLKELPSQTIVGNLPSFARTRFWKAEQRIQDFNPVVHKVADKYNLKVASLYEKTAADKSLLTNSSDIFHPSDRGYRNWATAFIEKL